MPTKLTRWELMRFKMIRWIKWLASNWTLVVYLGNTSAIFLTLQPWPDKRRSRNLYLYAYPRTWLGLGIITNYYELLRIIENLYSQCLSANCRDSEAAEICSQDFWKICVIVGDVEEVRLWEVQHHTYWYYYSTISNLVDREIQANQCSRLNDYGILYGIWRFCSKV